MSERKCPFGCESCPRMCVGPKDHDGDHGCARHGSVEWTR